MRRSELGEELSRTARREPSVVVPSTSTLSTERESTITTTSEGVAAVLHEFGVDVGRPERRNATAKKLWDAGVSADDLRMLALHCESNAMKPEQAPRFLAWFIGDAQRVLKAVDDLKFAAEARSWRQSTRETPDKFVAQIEATDAALAEKVRRSRRESDLFIVAVLSDHGGDREKAAAALSIPRESVDAAIDRLVEAGIDVPSALVDQVRRTGATLRVVR